MGDAAKRHTVRHAVKKAMRMLEPHLTQLLLLRKPDESGMYTEGQLWRTVLMFATGSALNAGLDEETLVKAVRACAKGWRDSDSKGESN